MQMIVLFLPSFCLEPGYVCGFLKSFLTLLQSHFRNMLLALGTLESLLYSSVVPGQRHCKWWNDFGSLLNASGLTLWLACVLWVILGFPGGHLVRTIVSRVLVSSCFAFDPLLLILCVFLRFVVLCRVFVLCVSRCFGFDRRRVSRVLLCCVFSCVSCCFAFNPLLLILSISCQ